MEGFNKQEKNEANGGDSYPMDMSTCEYNRHKGSDGFSKTEGNIKLGNHSHQYDRIKKSV